MRGTLEPEDPMGKRDPRVDAYIAKRAEFARPILERLRGDVHAGCPEVSETIKWGMPAFDYKGPLAGMAAFKQHATFGFWKGGLVVGEKREGVLTVPVEAIFRKDDAEIVRQRLGK